MGQYKDSKKYRYENLAINDYADDGEISIMWDNTSDFGQIILKDKFFGIQKINLQKSHIDAIEDLIKKLKEYGSY